jgi:hypothetical protein
METEFPSSPQKDHDPGSTLETTTKSPPPTEDQPQGSNSPQESASSQVSATYPYRSLDDFLPKEEFQPKDPLSTLKELIQRARNPDSRENETFLPDFLFRPQAQMANLPRAKDFAHEALKEPKPQTPPLRVQASGTFLSVLETLCHSLGDYRHTTTGWTLITAIFPSLFALNRPLQLLTSLTTPNHHTFASKFISGIKRTELATYHQLTNGILICKGDERMIYRDKATLPGTQHLHYNDKIYPYGWTTDASNFARQLGYDPDFIDQEERGNIEEQFIDAAIDAPNATEALDLYIKTIYAHTNGHHLTWLASEQDAIPDNLEQRKTLTNLHRKIAKQGGQVFHTKNGLRITIPENKWVNWKTGSPDSQREFTQVAWAQMTQFDKTSMMFALKEGKLGNNPIYVNFEDDAKHDEFWTTELSQLREYCVRLVDETRAYENYNPHIIQELSYYNQPDKRSPFPDWTDGKRPEVVLLPYSNLQIHWDENTSEWIRPLLSDSESSRSQGSTSSNSECQAPLNHHPLRRQNAMIDLHSLYSSSIHRSPTPSPASPVFKPYVENPRHRFHPATLTRDRSRRYRGPIDTFEAEDWESDEY